MLESSIIQIKIELLQNTFSEMINFNGLFTCIN